MFGRGRDHGQALAFLRWSEHIPAVDEHYCLGRSPRASAESRHTLAWPHKTDGKRSGLDRRRVYHQSMPDVPAEPHNHEFTVRQPVEATLGFSASVSSVPLVHVASASVYASGGASQVIVTPRPESPVPTVDASLSKSTWDLTTTGAGVTIGGQ